MRISLIAALLLCSVPAIARAAEAPAVLPRVEDPTPIMDGDLGEWANRGALCTLQTADHVTYRRALWKGLRDLSGWVRLGHDADHLYVACHVVDNVVTQSGSGVNIWRGDHIIVQLDFVRSGKKADVIQLGLSPGGLKPGTAVAPEVVIWEPAGLAPGGAAVAARRTTDGYDIEAAIPWAALNVKPGKNQTFAFDVAFSDSDKTPNRQEKCMSVSRFTWIARHPKRLLPAGLGDRTGFIPPDAFQDKSVTIAKVLVIPTRSKKEFTVKAGAVPEGLVPTLVFKARVVSPKVGGCIAGLDVDVNGKRLTIDNLAERPRIMQFVSGAQNGSWTRGMTLFYSPDFEAVEKSNYKPVGFKACDYVLRLDGLIREGENVITFHNNLHLSWAVKRFDIAMADVVLTWRQPSQFRPGKTYKPAPTGPLTVYEPDTRHRADYKARVLPGGAVRVSWPGKTLTVESRFSLPQGKWATLTARKAGGWTRSQGSRMGFKAGSGDVELTRTVIPYDECLLVRDTLKNTSEQIRPLIISHEASTGPYERLYLGGRPIRLKTGAASVPANPTVVVLGKSAGFGLMAHDDIFRLHCRSSCDGKRAALRDGALALRPGVTYVHEWLIVPLPRPDYWTFLNALRRHLKTNFTIPGSYAFLPAYRRKSERWPATKVGPFIDHKSAHYVAITTGSNYKGLFAHGPIKRKVETELQATAIKMARALRPDAKILAYFNCFDCARAKGDPTRWPECRALRPDGKELRGDGSTYPVYFSTLTNAYGKEMDLNVDWILNTIRADGIFWDMYNGYGMHYGEPWDGWSADIHPDTHALTRKKSSTALISWPWRKRLIERFLKEGRPMVVSGGPMFTSEYQYRIVHLTETADIGKLSTTHLFTPVALGDHTTEHNEVECYDTMLRALDWGGLYYWYSGSVIPTRTTLTARMFPFTPIELHKGYLIGEERILTKESGLFGWGDMSEFQVHVFDRVGKPTDKIKTPRLVKDGRACAEIRIPEGYSAAIVRKGSPAKGGR